MQRRPALAALAASLANPLVARAQTARQARVAWTSVDRATPGSPFLAAFRAGLSQLGWAEGQKLTLTQWWGGGTSDGLKALLPQIAAAAPEVIVGAGGPAARVMADAALAPPVAFAVSADPVLGKFVDNWSRPGVNRSGISFFSLDLIPKRMALLRELLPAARRVAIVGWPPHGGELLELDAARKAAEHLNFDHRYWGVITRDELDAALAAALAWKADAVFVFAGAVASNYAVRFAAFARESRLPTVSSWASFAEAGNVMCYGPVLAECYSRLASFADRMLRGARAAEMPVEWPTKFELVLNLGAARAIGLQPPRSLLLQADRVL
jgi:putative ABC transport system substrate-binding protein